jgi:hypothetical protein
MGQNGHANGGGNAAGANLAYTKFLFVASRQPEDPATPATPAGQSHAARLRAVGGMIARGFFNEFDVDGTRDAQPFETIQFLVQDGPATSATPLFDELNLGQARHVVQVSSKYRPRLQEIEEELRRRVGEAAQVTAIDGAARGPRYSSPEMQQHVQKHSTHRKSGRVCQHAIIVPMRKSAEWWHKDVLERHTYFYPHVDRGTGTHVPGHAKLAEPGLGAFYKRMYHNPDGYSRTGEYDFIGYFECGDDGLSAFTQICLALRDPSLNPEWRFVEEGPTWRGRRVLRW